MSERAGVWMAFVLMTGSGALVGAALAGLGGVPPLAGAAVFGIVGAGLAIGRVLDL